jgi:hypothetical protein
MSMLGDLPLPWPVEINLSRPAMEAILAALDETGSLDIGAVIWTDALQCEVDNFRNLLQNLLERSEPEPGNFDLIGE